MGVTVVPPFSQTTAEDWEEQMREVLGYYPGHDEGCSLKTTAPFGEAKCNCGPKETDDNH